MLSSKTGPQTELPPSEGGGNRGARRRVLLNEKTVADGETIGLLLKRRRMGGGKKWRGPLLRQHRKGEIAALGAGEKDAYRRTSDSHRSLLHYGGSQWMSKHCALCLAADGILLVIAVNEVPSEEGQSSQQWKSWAPFRVITVPLLHCATQNHSNKLVVFLWIRSGAGCRDGLTVKISPLFLQVRPVIPFLRVGY